jgi:hypothetical protein
VVSITDPRLKPVLQVRNPPAIAIEIGGHLTLGRTEADRDLRHRRAVDDRLRARPSRGTGKILKRAVIEIMIARYAKDEKLKC